MADSVTHWLSLLKSGDGEGARRLWERYFAQVVNVAQGRLRGLNKRMADEEDVAQSAFGSFYRAVAGGRFPELENRRDLWQILLSLTIRKAIDLRRREQALRRGGAPVTEETPVLQEDTLVESLLSREPDPQFSVLVAEEIADLFGRLKDDPMRAIAQRKLEGFTNEEVATHLGCSLRTVERRLEMIRRTWDTRARDPQSPASAEA